MTLFKFGAIRCASENAIHISPEVIEFGTVDISIYLYIYIYTDESDREGEIDRQRDMVEEV